MNSIEIMPKNKNCESNNNNNTITSIKSSVPKKANLNRFHRRKFHHNHNNQPPQQQQQQQQQIYLNQQQQQKQKYQYNNSSYISSSSSTSSLSSSSNSVCSNTNSSNTSTLSNTNHNNIAIFVNNLYNNSNYNNSSCSSDFMQYSPLKTFVTNLNCGGKSSANHGIVEKHIGDDATTPITTELKNVEGMNTNFNIKTAETSSSSATSSSSSYTPPPSYSLEFLHYVGVQIAAGRNIPVHHGLESIGPPPPPHTPPPPPPTVHNINNKTVNNNNNFTKNNEENHHEMSTKTSASQQHQQHHPQSGGFYYHDIPMYPHNIGSGGGGGEGGGGINNNNNGSMAYHNNRYPNQNYYNNNNNYHMYNRNHHHNNQKSMQHNQHRGGGGNGGNWNNGQNYNNNWSYNRNVSSSSGNGSAQQQMPSQNGAKTFNHNHKSHYNNNSTINNKNYHNLKGFTSYHQNQLHYNRRTNSNGSLNNLNNKNSNARPNNNRILNSRSPTPSPKSESPPIEHPVEVIKQLPEADIEKPKSTKPIPVVSAKKAFKNEETLFIKPPTPSNTIQTSTENCFTQLPPPPLYNAHQQMPLPSISPATTNGYDSDSSLSSACRDTYYVSAPSPLGHQLIEIPSSMTSYRQFGDDTFLGYYTFYGSHQNLTNWGALNHHSLTPSHTSQHKSSYSSSSSDTGPNLFDDQISEDGSLYKKKSSGSTSLPSSTTSSIKYRSKKPNTVFALRGSLEYMHTPPDRFLAKAHLVETKNPGCALLVGDDWDAISQNIWDRFIAAQQTEETFRKKMLLWRYLFLSIKKSYPRYGLYLVGSTITGFGTENSDVDMCLVSRLVTHNDPRIEALFNLTELKDYLINTTMEKFEEFNLIQAKVPILRFRDTHDSLEVDLNFNNSVGIKNTHLLYCYQQMDWRLKPLCVVVKLWAQYHHINNAKNSTISSYSLVLMVVHFLQCGINPPVLPCLHTLYPDKFQKNHDLSTIDMIETMKPFASENRMTLGELFCKFLEYYSNFDYSIHAISIRTASVLPIEECRLARSIKNDPHQWKQLCIEEPFDLTNTARSVYDCEIFERIKSVFVTSWKVLQETMDLHSLFSTVFLIPPEVPIHHPPPPPPPLAVVIPTKPIELPS